MSSEESGDYELVLAPPAQRALAGKLPEPVATAVIEFLTTSLIRQPYRMGKPLFSGPAAFGRAARAFRTLTDRIGVTLA